MNVTPENTDTIIKNMRSEGSQSRADYLELMSQRLAEAEEMLRDCVTDYINFDNGHLTESVFKRASELLNGKIECPLKEASGKGE